MKNLFTFCFSFFIYSSSISQVSTSKILDFTHFRLITKKDTIDFIVSDTNLTAKKPVLLFCQGSLPVPLFFDLKSHGIVNSTLNNFDLASMRKKYHVVCISMPKTPVLVSEKNLNRSYCYVPDTLEPNKFDDKYVQADYLENYVRRANTVLNYLINQHWVDSKNVTVVGHSQGTPIAVNIASTNKKVTKLGLFGYNPLGRIDKNIRSIRKNATLGLISWEKADTLQQEQYDFYKEVYNDDSLRKYPSINAWRSFSKSTIPLLTNLSIPIYIAYGSEDVGTDLCDLLPIYFIEKRKTNYRLKRYPNLDHNFFPVDTEGKVDYTNGKWREVMNAFVDWSLM